MTESWTSCAAVTAPLKGEFPMPDSILAIDFGTSTSSAILTTAGRHQPLRDSVTGSFSWPSSVFLENGRLLVGTAAEQRKHSAPENYRTGFKRALGSDTPITLGGQEFQVSDLVAAVLRRLRQEAQEVAGHSITRTVLTIPSAFTEFDPRRAAMIKAGRAAGFLDIDLLPEPVAAALAPIVKDPFAPGDTVLVYDLGGGTFDAALVRFGTDGAYEVLDHASEENTGGRAIDAILVAHVLAHAAPEIAVTLTPAVGKSQEARQTALRTALIVEDQVRELKHHLSEQDEAAQYLSPLLPPIRLDRATLAEKIESLVAATVALSHQLVAGAGLTYDRLDGVLRIGGSSRMVMIGEALASMGPPVRRPEDFDLAVVQGAARWADGSADRALTPTAVGVDDRPLRWTLPFGQYAEFTRWAVRPREIYAPGAVLAIARLQDGSLWRLRDDHAAGGLLGHVQCSPGDRVMTGDWLATTRPVAPELVLGHNDQVSGMAFSPDGSRLGTSTDAPRRLSVTAVSRLWDEHGAEITGHGRDGSTVVVNQRGGDRLLMATLADGALEVWDAVTGDEVLRVSHDKPLGRVVVDVTAGLVAVTAHGDTVLRLRRVGPGESDEPLEFDHRGSPVTSVEFSRNGAGIVTASQNGTVMTWSTETGEQRREFKHGGVVNIARFSPDDTRLVTAGSDVDVRIWDSASGVELVRLRHPNRVNDACFAPEGARVATACADGKVRIWDAVSGHELLALGPVSNSPATAVTFSPDGARLATAGTDHSVRIWRLAHSHRTRD